MISSSVTEFRVITFALSQYIGLFMLIMAVIMSSRVVVYRKMIQQADPHSGTILLGACIGLLIGIYLVSINNIWILKPGLLVTLICWLVVICSILWLSIPERMLKLTTKTLMGSGYYIVVFLLGGWGIIFLTKGVYIYVTHRNDFPLLNFINI